MSIETKLREGSQAIKQATRLAEFTSTSPAERRGFRSGPLLALVGGLAIVAVMAIPALLSLGGQPGGGVPVAASDDSQGAPTTVTPPEAAVPTTVPVATTLPDVEGAIAVAEQFRASPLQAEQLKKITGMEADLAHTGYLIHSTMSTDGAYELGLIVYESRLPNEGPLTCFSSYALHIEGDVNVAGGSLCGGDPATTEEIASFDMSIAGSCGAVPKEEPVVDGVWTIMTIWGLPEGAETATVALSDGSTLDVAVDDGVAHNLWEASIGIENITFDGMTDQQRNRVDSFMPALDLNC